jgi:glycosyltransferase involved in cell wall biosynthesis
VSVIVPCFNYGRYLAECLKSVSSQTLTDWECIVIDNGSTDDTRAVAQKFLASDHRFRYYYTPQQGVSAARNFGIAQSHGKFILPLDADDKIANSYLKQASQLLTEQAGVKVVYSDAQLFGAVSRKWILPEFSFKDLLVENSIFCSAVFRKEDFLKTNGYNQNMRDGFEDWDFWISFLKDGGKAHKIPETLFFYRIRPESRNNSLSIEKQKILRKQIYENHRELYHSNFSVPDLIFQNYQLKRELQRVKDSRSQKLVSFLRSPLKNFRNLKGRRK